MATSRPSRLWAFVALLVILVLAGAGVALYSAAGPDVSAEDMMDRQTFLCYAVSESARTVAPARLERKEVQARRIQRLLDTDRLEPLDVAKLDAELAILLWDMEDARFLRDCAETYYRPGSTHLRESVEAPPPPLDPGKARKAYAHALDAHEPRTLPHGFDERARLHLAQAAVVAGDYKEAREIASTHLEAHPSGLYSDSFQLVLADAALSLGDTGEAVTLYREVGKLKIGQDAHYARYRLAQLLIAKGQQAEAEEILEDVKLWAQRGDREALEVVLEGKELPGPAVK